MPRNVSREPIFRDLIDLLERQSGSRCFCTLPRTVTEVEKSLSPKTAMSLRKRHIRFVEEAAVYSDKQLLDMGLDLESVLEVRDAIQRSWKENA